MRRNLVVALPAALVAVGACVVGGADAAVDAPSTVTIKAEGTDLSGKLKSPKLQKCVQGRKVIVFKQKGTRGGGDDINFASDTADVSGTVGEWSTGTTGTEGRFYAKVRPIDGCKGDTSDTIRARRSG
jgi:hypothetical protein